nr:MAG: hypothetical protein [Molluscum contagiosum virus]
MPKTSRYLTKMRMPERLMNGSKTRHFPGEARMATQTSAYLQLCS